MPPLYDHILDTLTGTGKVVIAIANIFLLLLAIGLVVTGLTFVSSPEPHKSMPWRLDGTLKEAAKHLGSSVETRNLILKRFFTPLGTVLICVGLMIGISSSFGLVGACSSNKCLLKAHLVMVLVMVMFVLLFTIFIYGTFNSLMRPLLKKMLKEYTGLEGTDTSTVVWNALMAAGRCCGIDNYADFQDLPKWPATIKNQTHRLITPVMCCKRKTMDYDCAENPTNENSYWQRGCHGVIFKGVLGNPSIIIMLGIYLISQFILICFTVITLLG